MAKVYVTGPAYIYVGVGNIALGSGSGISGILSYPNPQDIYFLGSCQQPPRILINPKFKPIFADIGGSEVPYDWMFMGEDAAVFGVLNYWNESVYAKCASRPYPYLDTRGAQRAAGVGSLMVTQGFAYHLWIRFPYAAKPVFSDMPGGYHFTAAWMSGPDEINPGTRSGKRAVAFHCARVYNAANGTWSLYDHDMTSVPVNPPDNENGLLV